MSGYNNVQSKETNATGVSFLATVIAFASLLYTHVQTGEQRQQTEALQAQAKSQQEQVKILQEQTAMLLQQKETENTFLSQATFTARFEAVQGTSNEVQLVIENKGYSAAEIKHIQINGIDIAHHPLFHKKQFDADHEGEEPVPFFIQHGSARHFLTVASVPSQRAESQSIVHKPVWLHLCYADDLSKTTDNEMVAFNMSVPFSQKFIFPRDYLRWHSSQPKFPESPEQTSP